MKILGTNKKANFDYELSHKTEAGIVLEGWEVKSIKNHRFSLEGAFVKPLNNELYLVNARVSKWLGGYYKKESHETRERKLLLAKAQIMRLTSLAKTAGFTIIPYEFYINDKGLIKLTIALAKGKKKFDKREALKKRDLERELRRI